MYGWQDFDIVPQITLPMHVHTHTYIQTRILFWFLWMYRASGLIVIFCFVDLVHWSIYCMACTDFAASRRLIIDP